MGKGQATGRSEDQQLQTGRIVESVRRAHVRNTLVAVSLSSIGLVTFWGVHIYGKNALLRYAQTQAREAEHVS